MPRNAELVRQWEILRDIDAARTGISVARLAAARGVHQRTIRRDIDALARAGFSLYDDKSNGTSMWKLRTRPFRVLGETGLGVTEICALYLSHAMLRTLSGPALLDDGERAFAKIERALPPGCRRFLDQIPCVVKAKTGGRKKQDEQRISDIVRRVLDATLLHRRAEMRYAKPVKGITCSYLVEPHRIVYAHGGMYLLAYVPAYEEVRTFAVERIRTFAVTDETFSPRPLPVEPFAHSLGVHTGAPERIVIEFEADAAAYVREREWHASQRIQELADGQILLTLDVCRDYALRAWILGFAGSARVVEPLALAREVFDAAGEVRGRYAALPSVKAKMLRAG